MKARNWTYSLALLSLLGTTAGALPIAGGSASGQQAQASASGADLVVRSAPKPSSSRDKHEVHYAVFAQAGASSQAVMVQSGSLANASITNVSLPLGDTLVDEAHGVTFYFVIYGAGSGSAQLATQSQAGLPSSPGGTIIFVAKDRLPEPGQSFPDPLEPSASGSGVRNQAQKRISSGLGITNFSQRPGGRTAQGTVPAGQSLELIVRAVGPRTSMRRVPEELGITNFALSNTSSSSYQAGKPGQGGTIILVARDKPLETGASATDPLEPNSSEGGALNSQKRVPSGLGIINFSQRKGGRTAQGQVQSGSSLQ